MGQDDKRRAAAPQTPLPLEAIAAGEVRVSLGPWRVRPRTSHGRSRFAMFEAALRAPGGPLSPEASSCRTWPLAPPPPRPAARRLAPSTKATLRSVALFSGGALVALLLTHDPAPRGMPAPEARPLPAAPEMVALAVAGPSALLGRTRAVLAEEPGATAGARAATAAAATATVPTEAPDEEVGHTFYRLGWRLQQSGHLEEAAEAYERAATLDAGHAATFYNWGLLLEQQGEVLAAANRYREAIRLDPGHRFAHYNLGWLLQKQGDEGGARRAYEEATAAGAATALTWYNLGWLRQKAGDEDDAVAAYREAIASDPGLAAAHYNLGWLLQRQGDTEGAATHYTAALAADPGHALARQGLEGLH